MSSSQKHFADTDLPALHRAAGKLAADSQREHLRGNQLLLLLLLAGALISALSPVAALLPRLVWSSTEQASSHGAALVQDVQKVCASLAAITLACGLWLTALLRTTKKAEAWYDGRAVAESAKSMAWKYMTRAAPYDSGMQALAVDALFCGDLAKLLTDIKGHLLPGAAPRDGDQITSRMRHIRALNAPERLSFYLSARLEDQQSWYARRSSDHAAASRLWFWITLVVNVIALILAISAILWTPANAALGFATTATSCAIAWAQLHRYADLAHSYGFTSHEIGLLKPRSVGIDNDDALARFVADCETAFSREHTMWRARREIAES